MSSISHRARLAAIALLSSLLVVCPPAAAQPPAAAGAITGVVATQSGTIRLGGAELGVRDGEGRVVASVFSDGDGAFRVADLRPGKYTIAVALEGFAGATIAASVAAGRTTSVAIDLTIAALTDTVTVVAPDTVVSSAETLSASESITATEVERLSPGGGLTGALRLLASVIQVPGGLSIKGGRPTQAGMQIGSTTLADPVLGETHLTLPDDAIESVRVLPNPYAVEYGRFSSGLVVIQTRRAGDEWRVRLNNFDPTFRTKRLEDYKITGIATFGPRLEFGGPIVKDRLFLEEAAQYRYSADDVPSRPETELRTSQWFSSFTRVDATVSPRESFVATAAIFPSVTHMASLGTFVPPDATVDTHDHVTHGALTARTLWSGSVAGESTVQVYSYSTTLTGQGTAPMQLWPDTTLGNYYNTQTRTPSTLQAIETISATADGGATGLHLFKFGVDVLRSSFTATSVSRPILVMRADGTLARRIDFDGPSAQDVQSTDVALFAQDRVQPSPHWYAEYGVRLDRDGIIGRWNATPRVGAALLLNEEGTSVLRGGYGFFYERTPSAAGAFDQFETEIDSRFAADGVTMLGPSVAFPHVTAGGLRTARSATWDLSYDVRLARHWRAEASLITRDADHELVVDSVQNGAAGLWLMESTGHSDFRSAEVSLRYSRSAAVDVKATYTRSSAAGDLNSFANFFDTMMSPIITPNAFGPASTDVPNRLFARGHWLLSPRWQMIGIVDWRSGLPYSIVDADRDVVGARNALRMPSYMRL
ncbi:MAG TPA: TonB-dependent receptor, partial [Vicinamibacterales bacterium]|nr:TonB-dependent receptor [Vicinamibacterales bacterium]